MIHHGWTRIKRIAKTDPSKSVSIRIPFFSPFAPFARWPLRASLFPMVYNACMTTFLDLNVPKHAHVDQRLRSEPIIWISTVRPDGRPHLVPVWFLWEGSELFIFSQPAAQKVRNLMANPAVTLALEAADEGGDVAIIEGVATMEGAGAAEAIIPGYTAKYAEAIAAMGWTPETMLGDYSTLIRVRPSRLITW